MDLNRIKKFAQGSRRKLITQIESRLEYVLGHDDAYLRAHAKEKAIIQELHERKGRKHLLEEVAYTWFNRLAALRYMDAKGFFPVRIVTPAAGETQPQILAEVKAGRLPDQIQTARSQINDYLDGRVQTPEPEREAYKAALLAWCNAMGEVLPFLFTTVEDWVALLLPTDLLSRDSIVSDFQTGMKDEDCTDVEIIGWLYQFYISEKKDEVIGKVVASEDIPAATQLFTPNWIVKYMVQNSLGAQWLATYPDSPLKGQMEYYIEPAEQTDEVKAQLAAITPSTLDPEELTLIDPACGSGHILTEAYDLFKAIYLERGYSQQDVAQLILEKNLFGLDIDERAAQLSGFALMMKARVDDRRLFERGVKLNVRAMVDSTGFDAEGLAQGLKLADYGLQPGDLMELKRLFEHATTFGSLIHVPEGLAEKLPALRQLSEETSQDLFVSDALKRLAPLVQQAEMLAAHYDAVVANPPYMGSKFYCAALKDLVNTAFAEGKADLYGVFTLRNILLAKDNGYVGMITIPNWMFLSSFESLRDVIFGRAPISNLVHNGRGVWGSDFGSCAYVLKRGVAADFRGTFLRLFDTQSSVARNDELRKRFHQRKRFTAANSAFKKIPGSPVAYWVSDSVLRVFEQATLVGELVDVRQGLATADNNRFLRMWYEPGIDRVGLNLTSSSEAQASGRKWFPYNKGGDFRRWYGNQDYVVNWENDGCGIRAFGTENGGRPRSRAQNTEFYFQPSLSWSKVTIGGFALRKYPPGFIFDVAGCSVFGENLTPILGCMNSSIMSQVVNSLSPTVNFEVGQVQGFPLMHPVENNKRISQLVDRLIAASRLDWNSTEKSWEFQSLPILTALSEHTPTLETSYTAWITQNRDSIAEMKRLEEENNRLFIDAYGLQDELTPDVPIEQITLTVNPAYRYGGKLTEEEQWTRFRQDTMKELVSYAIGCMMGRYSLDKPGLILANTGDGIQEYLNRVPDPRFMPDSDAILPITAQDDFEDDLPSRVRAFVRVAFGKEHYDENIRFLEEGLGYDIKTYVLRHFYKDHLQRYKTRPIYWMVSSPSGAFRCLIYLHRYTQDTVGTILGSYLRPYRHKLEARREQNRRIIDSPTGSSADKSRAQKTVDEITRTLQELEEWERKVVYPLAQERIALDLDDGVKVNYGKLGAILEKVKGLNG